MRYCVETTEATSQHRLALLGVGFSKGRDWVSSIMCQIGLLESDWAPGTQQGVIQCKPGPPLNQQLRVEPENLCF